MRPLRCVSHTPGVRVGIYAYTMKPPIRDTPKEDKPPNKRQAESTHVYTLYRKSPLKQDNFSTKDKMAGPKSVLIMRFHCIPISALANCPLFDSPTHKKAIYGVSQNKTTSTSKQKFWARAPPPPPPPPPNKNSSLHL